MLATASATDFIVKGTISLRASFYICNMETVILTLVFVVGRCFVQTRQVVKSQELVTTVFSPSLPLPCLHPFLPPLLDVLCGTVPTTPSFIQALYLLFKPPLIDVTVFCLLSFNPSSMSQPESSPKASLVSQAFSKKTASNHSHLAEPTFLGT